MRTLNRFQNIVYYIILIVSIIMIITSVFIMSIDLMFSGCILYLIGLMISYIFDIIVYMVRK